MDYRKASESEIKEKMKNIKSIHPPSQAREVPVGAGRPSDDLSKVMSNDIIGKGGESDLRK